MFSYKPNAICMAGMTMPVGAGHAASHCWNRVRKPRQLINYARFWPQWWTFAKNRTAHAQTHYRKSTQWQWASFVSARLSPCRDLRQFSVSRVDFLRWLYVSRVDPLLSWVSFSKSDFQKKNFKISFMQSLLFNWFLKFWQCLFLYVQCDKFTKLVTYYKAVAGTSLL